MRCLAALLIAVFLAASCTTRVVREPAEILPASDALDINHAPATELERLPGIGPTTAEAIVEFRTANGPFRRVEHLLMVRGVSEQRFVEMRPLVRAE